MLKTWNKTTIIIDEKSKKGKLVLELIKEFGIGKIIVDKDIKSEQPNQVTLNAIIEAYEGKTIVCEDFQDYFQKVV